MDDRHMVRAAVPWSIVAIPPVYASAMPPPTVMPARQRQLRIAVLLAAGRAMTAAEIASAIGVPVRYVVIDLAALTNCLPLCEGDDGRVSLMPEW